MAKHLTRRQFIETTALAGAAGAIVAQAAQADAAVAPSTIPLRDFGKNGVKVTMLAFGCGSRFLAYQDEDEAQRVLNAAIDGGIRYLDTAFGYGNGASETRVGRTMATRRKDVFLATKLLERTRKRDEVLREFERSLKRLQTDHLDLVHIHSLKDEDDLAAIEAPDGALKALYELREQKVTRFIGMTSHTNGKVMAQAIERHDLNAVQMAMNPSRALGFEELALPARTRKGWA
jgi:aryl-alcohol dehydrogenase-like predicted oxidoreductase